MSRKGRETATNRIASLKRRLPADFRVAGRKIYLRPLSATDATPRYCAWMNDAEVTRYTESRYSKTTLSSLKQYLRNTCASPSNFFFAIIESNTGLHIGNIKIDSVVTPFWDH